MNSRANFTEKDTNFVWRNISIPSEHCIMITFEQNVPRALSHTLPKITYLKLYAYDSNGGKTVIWSRAYAKTDFAHAFPHSPIISIKASRDHCRGTSCFKLFFSFFPKNETPQSLGDFSWNCSVSHYPKFRHHLECNLRKECEDGQDENERCPFSSRECQGLVALCNKCYKFVESLNGFSSDASNVNQRANAFCHTVGGVLGMPKCVHSWCEELRDSVTIHRFRLAAMWLGLYSRDLSLPNMYRFVLMGEDSTALHHSVYRGHFKAQWRFCYKSGVFGTFGYDCNVKSSLLSYGAVCEIETHSSKKKTYNITWTANTGFVKNKERLSLTVCPDQHLTHSFLLCGSHLYKVCGKGYAPPCTFSEPLSKTALDSIDLSVPLFVCDNEAKTLPYSLLCDFIADCRDKKDESFCKHPTCEKMFTCDSSQCVSFDEVCDFINQCFDQSDEKTCTDFRDRFMPRESYDSPVLITFDKMRHFTIVEMNSSELCPETHYRCPGELNDCLPVYTRCNGIFDCIGHEDEADCEDVKCPGFFRCRTSRICVHGDHLCDGWPHCPMNDDEMDCDVICPKGCQCQGHAFRCFHPMSLATSSKVRSLDGTGSNITVEDVSDQSYLILLILSECSLTMVPRMSLLNLKYLCLSGNRLQHVNLSSFTNLVNLQKLTLSYNPITSLYSNPMTSDSHLLVSVLDLSHSTLTMFDPDTLSTFSQLQTLNLSFSPIHTISPNGFQSLHQLTSVYMEGSPVKTFPADVFKGLWNLHTVTAQNYKLCCSQILPENFDETFCSAPKDEISSCKDLLQSGLYRGFLWVISCLSVTGNVFCFLVRLCTRNISSTKSGYSVFVTNLCLADFLMGFYIAVIGVADLQFRGKYLHVDHSWKTSVACKMAGFLSLLSSEVSALIIGLITVDRFVVLRFPFSTLRFQKRSAAAACLVTWSVGWFLALFPLLPVTSHWEFYSQTGICIPLPVTRREFKGQTYSFGVLIGLNFVLFLVISAGQAFVYRSIQKNALRTGSSSSSSSSTSKLSQDVTIARRLITVALTDFMCWFPIGLCGVLALVGVPVPGEVNVVLAIFVLPLNAAINPFIYTLNIVVEKRRQSEERQLLKWMESRHADWAID